MKFLLLLIFSIFTSNQLTSAQDLSCQYQIGFNGSMAYTCLMSINNPNGFDSFSSIGGEHLPGWSDSSVWDVIFTSGISTNFPQIICQRFSSLQVIDASFPLQLTTLSASSFSGCMGLQRLVLNGRITSIEAGIFQNNIGLSSIELGRVELATLSPWILGFASGFFGIDAPLVTDLPANFFSGTMNIRNVQLRSTNLQQFRREWFRNFQMESIGLSGSLSITEIPRDSFRASSIREIRFDNTGIRTLDTNSFNLIEGLQLLDLTNTPIEALDFNLFERSLSFHTFRGTGMRCASLNTNSFHLNRAGNFATLEPCFAAFDARVMSKFFIFFLNI
jgi:hypothetical protein